MSVLTQNSILDHIRRISQAAKDQPISSETLESLESETNFVAQYLSSTPEEAFFFSVVLSLYFNGREVEFNDLCRFFDTNSFEILPHLPLLDGFVQNGLLIRKGPGKRMSDIPFFKSYAVAAEVCDAIVKNKPCPILKKTYQGTLIDALEMMYDKIVCCLDDEIGVEDLYNELDELAKAQQKFKYFKTIKALALSNIDFAVLVYVSWLTIIGSKRVDADRVLKTLIRRNAERAKYLQEIYYQQNPLIKNGLIETKEARFFNDVDFLISDKTKTILEDDGIKMPNKNSKRTDVLLPEKIAEKALFYNDHELAQIEQLRAALEHNTYTDIAERLKSKHLGTGMTILLFGEPGTGKTELVLQLARQTGRQIDNIARKCEINQILVGTYPTLTEIEKYCEEERSMTAKTAKTIGFGRGASEI